MSQKLPYAIIIGLDSFTAIQTSRILAKHKIPILGVEKNLTSPFCRSRVYKNILHSDIKSKLLIEKLEKLGPKLDEKAVLIPTCDSAVYQISLHRHMLEPWFHIMLPEHKVVELLSNKVNFYNFAKKKGYPIPKTYFLENQKDAEEAARTLRYPVVLKPPFKSDMWIQQVKKKVLKVFNPHQLLFIYKKTASCVDVLIAQEWIEGPDSNLFSCNAYFNSQSIPLVTFVSRKIRQWPPNTGVSSLGVECSNDKVRYETIQLFKELYFKGLCYLEMKYDTRNQEYYIIEPNIGRPTGRSAIAEAGGVELLYTFYCDVLGLALPKNLKQQYSGAKWLYLRNDLQSILIQLLRREITPHEIFVSWQGRKAFAVHSWNDPYPFLSDIWKGISFFPIFLKLYVIG